MDTKWKLSHDLVPHFIAREHNKLLLSSTLAAGFGKQWIMLSLSQITDTLACAGPGLAPSQKHYERANLTILQAKPMTVAGN